MLPDTTVNPPRWPPLVVVGLTGGIASGKSTVASMFRDLGAEVVNADEEGKAAVAPGEPALAEIARAFGPQVLLADGTLDRPRMAARIFASPGDRRALNRITHPRITERLIKKIRNLATHPPRKHVVVVEAALLVEAGWAPLVDKIVVVTAQHSIQVARLIARHGLAVSDAEARVRAQLPARSRLRWADYRISGETALSQTRDQVAAVWDQLVRIPRRG